MRTARPTISATSSASSVRPMKSRIVSEGPAPAVYPRVCGGIGPAGPRPSCERFSRLCRFLLPPLPIMASGDPIEITFERAKLRKAGERAVSLIKQRTQRGEDRFGKDFAPYSTRPFAMPAGGLNRKREALSELGADYFQRNGSLWAIIEGGYAAYKKERYKNAPGGGETVNLTATGAMLRALSVTRVVSSGAGSDGGKVVVGFTSVAAAEKAYYHSVAGAGPSETIRDFMGLTEEADEVAEIVGRAVTIKV